MNGGGSKSITGALPPRLIDVIARTAANRDLQIRVRTENIELIVSTSPAQLQLLDPGEVDNPAGARHEFLVTTKVSPMAVPLMTMRVVAGPAVDVNRAVLEVLVPVRARATEQRRQVRDARSDRSDSP